CSLALSSFPSPFPDPPHSELYPLSLHDALPISLCSRFCPKWVLYCTLTWAAPARKGVQRHGPRSGPAGPQPPALPAGAELLRRRSEEHTSELQSRFDLVCRLLLEKKTNAAEIRH